MRLLDLRSDSALTNVLLLLTPAEAAELRDALESMLQQKPGVVHEHICDDSYKHQITVSVYQTPDPFNERVRRLILDDK